VILPTLYNTISSLFGASVPVFCSSLERFVCSVASKVTQTKARVVFNDRKENEYLSSRLYIQEVVPLLLSISHI
jgi:hypothetical protein